MATEIWWIDPPRNVAAGGWMSHKYHADEVDTVYTQNLHYYSGFQCLKQAFFPLDAFSDQYECWAYHFFTKFRVPATTSGTFQSAELYLMLGGADLEMNVSPNDLDIDIYYKSVYDADTFPWQMLDEGDYTSPTWTQNPNSIENFNQIWGNFVWDGPSWLDPVVVTSGVQEAIDEGWDWIAFRFVPSYLTPHDYNWNDRPTAYDQLCWLGFYGPINPYWVVAPSGFSDTHVSPCPWLKITYSGGDAQYVPGEDVVTSGQGSTVNCVAADPKAKMAIAGTEGGNLWHVWSGGGEWNKIIDGDEAITAVWMDHIRNFQDYPYDEIAWYGTVSGNLYKSENSLGTFSLMKAFSTQIVEIMSSNQDSNKVVVGVLDGVWVSMDGGNTWTEGLEAPMS